MSTFAEKKHPFDVREFNHSDLMEVSLANEKTYRNWVNRGFIKIGRKHRNRMQYSSTEVVYLAILVELTKNYRFPVLAASAAAEAMASQIREISTQIGEKVPSEKLKGYCVIRIDQLDDETAVHYQMVEPGGKLLNAIDYAKPSLVFPVVGFGHAVLERLREFMDTQEDT